MEPQLRDQVILSESIDDHSVSLIVIQLRVALMDPLRPIPIRKYRTRPTRRRKYRRKPTRRRKYRSRATRRRKYRRKTVRRHKYNGLTPIGRRNIIRQL